MDLAALLLLCCTPVFSGSIQSIFSQHFGTQNGGEQLFYIDYSLSSFSRLFLELRLKTASITTFSTLPTAVGFEVLSKEPRGVRASPGQLGAAK